MISREHRFHGRASLNFVYRQGQTVRGPSFSVRYCNNSRRKTYRAAVVVSRKVNKSAVVRNRLRRRFYDGLQTVENRIAQPYDIVITIFDDSLDKLEAVQINKNLEKSLDSAGILS